ncbi:carbonic anhydrase [Mytilinidion resinicola]|uniref:Carbonic anhydrase n=1 Tax=Mytilinidion resinicola TaxID=574789 RepID=A0A6A6YSB1_9PEZI|nr:carbonic anhydrase [Mytilinidion resinicola]KAF2810855.1 carbonic anhydrase [Mytilinidion resinicola]
MMEGFRTEVVDSHLIPSLRKPIAQILWIGCSDSGWAETRTLDLLPEEIIVHRSPGDLVSNNDLSTLSTLEYALGILKVDHIVICGHYGCRLVNTHADSSPLCEWLRSIYPPLSPSSTYTTYSQQHSDVNALYNAHRPELDALPISADRDRRLVELHVWAQTQVLLARPDIIKAQAERGLKVHGFVYDDAKDQCVDLIAGGSYHPSRGIMSVL